MGSLFRSHELHAFVSQGRHVHPIEESLSATEQDRRNGNVELIDQARTKVLLYGIDPTTNPHVRPVRSFARLVERLVNAACDEVKCRAAFHRYGGRE